MSTTESPPTLPVPTLPRIRYVDLLLALPAIVIALALVGALAQKSRSATLIAAYERDGLDRFKKNELQAALLDFKRLSEMQPARADYRFFLVSIYERLGMVDRAVSLAIGLAPLDGRPGFGPAHLWLARQLLASAQGSQAQLRLVEQHLQISLKSDPNSSFIKLQLAEVYNLVGRPDLAKPYLQELALENPELLVLLAQTCARSGDLAAARGHAENSVAILGNKSAANPEDVLTRTLLADSHILLDDYASAFKVLKAGLDLLPAENAASSSDSEQVRKKRAILENSYHKGLASVCVSWSDHLTKTGKSTPAERLAVIERGLGYEPDDEELLARLALLSQAPGADAEKLLGMMRGMLAAGKTSPVLHLALGNEASRRGQRAEARTHWEQAMKGKATLALAANNLAFSLAYHEPADPTRALSLIDQALEQAPKDAILRGTRGQVLNKLGRWKDALVDLEAAYTAGQKSPTIQGALAEAHRHLGDGQALNNPPK